MKWSEDYATGIEQIDEDHKTIFKMSEDFRIALDEGMGGSVYAVLLDALHMYCRGHFGYEEQCMHEHQCPVAQKNKDAHAGFLKTMTGFQQRYTENGFDPVDARRLIDTIDSWLANHICRIDIHLKKCVSK